jgi:beta-N-acetylhexosaminidase
MRALRPALFMALLVSVASAGSRKSSAPPQAKPALAEQLGQTFVVGLPGRTLDAETEYLLRQIKPGGIVLYRRNFASPAQLQELISRLQTLARETTHRPYLIMIDEEPGGATRLGLFSNVFAFGEPDWVQIERDISVLERLGINVELAPVADYPFNHNSFIRSRVPAHSVKALTEFNQRFIALLARHGISATLKHFPGMGAFRMDPHHELPAGHVAAAGLDASLRIFQDGIAAGAGLVMTGHAVYTNVDPGRPATLSSTIVTGILRRQMKFQGLVITDDLSEMPFLEGTRMSLEQATSEALRAGHTMVLFSHKLPATKEVLDQVLAEAHGDPKLESAISRNYARIASFKNSHRGLERNAPAAPNPGN